MQAKTVLEGGCLCRGLRYQVSALPFAADYCHCLHCQKISGAPVMAWMDFKSDQVAMVKRSFDGICLFGRSQTGVLCSLWLDVELAYITLAIVSLDEPDLVMPTYHIYTDHQRRWCQIQDDLPRFKREQA